MSGARVVFGFIPIPREVVDDPAVDLSLGAWRLLAYLLRHRFRVKSEVFRLTQDELLSGVLGTDGITRRDIGCRITSPRDLKAAREQLESLGWLKVHPQARGAMVYELLLSGEEETVSANCTQLPDASASAKCTPQQPLFVLPKVQNAPAYKEEKVSKGKKASSSAESVSDDRHVPFRESCKTYADFKKVQFVWDGSEAKALSELLKAAPDLDLTAFQLCLRHRAKSDGVTDGERPRVYLSTITKYQQGPLDQFGRLKGNGDAANQFGPGGRGASRAAQSEREQFEGIAGAFAGLIADGAR